MKTTYTNNGKQITDKPTKIMEFMLIHHFLWWHWWYMKRLAFTGYETTWSYETDNFSETINLN
jgi:hypothetical protein